MGRKPKIIPPIPGTLEQIADAMFAKDKNIREKKKKKAPSDKRKSD